MLQRSTPLLPSPLRARGVMAAGHAGRDRARMLGAAVLTALLALVLAFSGLSAPAQAAEDYPTWDDVAAARNDEAAAAREAARIESFISGLQAEVSAAQLEAERTGTIYQEAQLALDDATRIAEDLQARADAAQSTADESSRRAGVLATQMSRSGGGDSTLELFIGGGSGEKDVLYQLGVTDQLSSQSASIFAEAKSDQNAASALRDEAVVAQDARQVLADEAQVAFDAAVAAQQVLEERLAATQADLQRLTAQLATLRDRTKSIEEGYREGIIAAIGAGAQLGAGQISNAGWARPVVGGFISSGFGSRIDPSYGGSAYHYGYDFGGLGCNANIFAASGGVVTYAGWYGGYGNAVMISHGDGSVTLYGHQIDGGIQVRVGQEVVVGQLIGKVGTTGKSTGCHLHYEVRIGGVATNPGPFMSARGITL